MKCYKDIAYLWYDPTLLSKTKLLLLWLNSTAINRVMEFDVLHIFCGGRATGSPYGKTQEWWPPPNN